MSSIDLDSCWAKLIRAEVHRHALYALDRAFWPEANCPTLGVKFDDKTGEHVIYVTRMPDYSNVFMRASLLFGDGVHNLRGVLDHLVYALADWNKGGAIEHPERTQFPICDNLGDFNAATERNLAEIHPDHVAIIERFQAYHTDELLPRVGPGEVHPFALLRDVSNLDKHRLLNVVVIPTRAYVLNFDMMGLAERLGQARLVPSAELGAELNRYVLREHLPDMDVAGHIPVSVSLGETRLSLVYSARVGIECREGIETVRAHHRALEEQLSTDMGCHVR